LHSKNATTKEEINSKEVAKKIKQEIVTMMVKSNKQSNRSLVDNKNKRA